VHPLPCEYTNRAGASISLGGMKEDWGSGDECSPAGSRSRAPVGVLENKVPQKLKPFCETTVTHNFLSKIQKTAVDVVTE